jgi:hypothetical protein
MPQNWFVPPPWHWLSAAPQQPAQFELLQVDGEPQVWLFPSQTPPLQFTQAKPE